MEDWDELERIKRSKSPEFPKWTPAFFDIKEDFRKFIGKIWQDKEKLRYLYNGEPVYVQYRIIAIEDNDPMADFYWVVQNVDDDRDIKYINVLTPIRNDIIF